MHIDFLSMSTSVMTQVFLKIGGRNFQTKYVIATVNCSEKLPVPTNLVMVNFLGSGEV